MKVEVKLENSDSTMSSQSTVRSELKSEIRNSSRMIESSPLDLQNCGAYLTLGLRRLQFIASTLSFQRLDQ